MINTSRSFWNIYRHTIAKLSGKIATPFADVYQGPVIKMAFTSPRKICHTKRQTGRHPRFSKRKILTKTRHLRNHLYLRQDASSDWSPQSSSLSQYHNLGMHLPFSHLNWSAPHWPVICQTKWGKNIINMMKITLKYILEINI